MDGSRHAGTSQPAPSLKPLPPVGPALMHFKLLHQAANQNASLVLDVKTAKVLNMAAGTGLVAPLQVSLLPSKQGLGAGLAAGGDDEGGEHHHHHK